ncbi:MAG: hypothetical protein COC12_10845 [Rhodobacteraceae bacterium]|nr:MAG: hypothetical protein COC12_10845 [Paracoccaceae bacterium]
MTLRTALPRANDVRSVIAPGSPRLVAMPGFPRFSDLAPGAARRPVPSKPDVHAESGGGPGDLLWFAMDLPEQGWLESAGRNCI